jgi:hypothetical protein
MKLAQEGVPPKLLNLLKDILQANLITTDNGVVENGGVVQAFRLDGTQLKVVGNSFTYLGITSLSTTGKSFTAHVEERNRKAMIAAAVTIEKPQKLSVTTAITLFHLLKITPTAVYGIPPGCLGQAKLSGHDEDDDDAG